MVAIFLVATVLFFLALDYLTQRARKRATVESTRPVPAIPQDRFLVPRGFFFNPGHVWAELLPSGNMRVGIDDFLRKIVGNVDEIHVLKQQSHVDRGEPVLVLKQGDRLLSVSAPVAGNVVGVNDAVLRNPEILANDPYAAGWILMMEPSDLQQDLTTLLVGTATAKWLKKEVSRFRDFIRTCTAQPQFAHAGVTMADGGFPLTGALQQATDQNWRAFEEQFLQVRVGSPDQSAHR